MVQQQPSPGSMWSQYAEYRQQTVGSIPADTGLNVPRFFDLPQVGYLEALDLSTALTFTFNPTATGQDAFAQGSGNLARVTLTVNSIAPLFDCSGFTLSFISALEYAYRYGASSWMPAPSAWTAFGSIGTTSKTNKWLHRMPIALYLQNVNYPIGLFQTALQNLSIRLVVRWLPIQATVGTPGSGQYSGGTVTVAQSGQVQINEAYFDPIPDPAGQPWLGMIHRWSEFQTSLTKSGDLQILLPGQNYYSRILYQIVSGATNTLTLDSTNLQRLRLMYGANLAPFDEDETNAEVSQRMQRQYPGLYSAMPKGVYWHDWIADTHDNRDWLNAAATTNLRAMLTMAAAGTYTGGGYVNTVTEEIAPLQLPSGATVQGQAVS